MTILLQAATAATTIDLKSLSIIISIIISLGGMVFGFGKAYSNIISLITKNQTSLEHITDLLQKDIDFLKNENQLRIQELSRKANMEYFKEKISYIEKEIEKLDDRIEKLSK